MSIILKPGDIFFTRGNTFISKAIRIFSRTIGESRSNVNHVGLIVQGGSITEAIIVEAVQVVKKHKLWDAYSSWTTSHNEVAVYRPKNLNEDQIKLIVASAEKYAGRTYGYFKILAHLLDWLLLGAYFFRRLTNMDDYPICSWVVAHAYAKAGKYFNVEPGAATPDDICDFVESRTDFYEEIFPLSKLKDLL